MIEVIKTPFVSFAAERQAAKETNPTEKGMVIIMYCFGNKLKIELEGQSHSPKMSVRLSGFPEGFRIDSEKLSFFMSRRKTGNCGSSMRREADEIIFSAGVENSITTGEDIVIEIENKDIKSEDYNLDVPRPGHADYTSYLKYGKVFPGGGRFSGRMTALLCAAGGIAKQLLEEKRIFVGAHAESVGGVLDLRFDDCTVDGEDISAIAEKDVPVIDNSAGERMCKRIEEAKAEGDSVGGVIECAVAGFPGGVGGELFEGIEGKLAQTLFAIPAVKGVEFGIGFAASDLTGSENNDEFYVDKGIIKTKTNNCGGVLGGISDTMPVIFRVAVKPTPSIAKKQCSVSLSEMKNTELEVGGRHDACIVFRAVPAVEAVSALTLLDMLL